MLSSKEKKKRPSENPSSNSINVIGEGTVVEGNLNSKGDIRIDGRLKGVVNSSSKFVLGTSGVIEGDIHARSADVSGTVNGNIHIAETLFLKSTARVYGDISTGKLVIESGSEFNGKCTMGKENVRTVEPHSQGPAKEVKTEARSTVEMTS